MNAVGIGLQDLAGLQLAYECSADRGDGGGLRGQQPGVLELAEAQGPKRLGIADPVHPAAVSEYERVGAGDLRQYLVECLGQVHAVVLHDRREQPTEDCGVGGPGRDAQLRTGPVGVHERAVVGQGECAVRAGLHHDGLSQLVVGCLAARSRVPHMSDGPRPAPQFTCIGVREGVRHSAGSGPAVDAGVSADGDAGALLTAVLEGHEHGAHDRRSRAPGTDDTARFTGFRERIVHREPSSGMGPLLYPSLSSPLTCPP